MTQYGENDGPLGMAPDISIGASDAVLLTVSVAGFCVLAWTVYSIILTKVKSARELQKEAEEREISYDERLAQADVSTLNRAQRRARARHIMKQQRAAAAAPNHVHPMAMEVDGDEHQQQHLLLEQQQRHDEDIPPFQDGSHHATAQHLLSRKERQKAAKQVELQERRLLEEDRQKDQRKSQEAATSKRKEKERILALQVEQDRKERQEQRQADELARYRAWKIFLENENKNDNNNNNNNEDPTVPKDNSSNSITVREWIQELKQNRIVSLKDLADRFQLSESIVHKRIQELLDESSPSRLSGILEKSSTSLSVLSSDKPGGHNDDDDKNYDGGNNHTTFIYLSPDDMSKLASFVKTQDKITAKEFGRRIQEQLLGLELELAPSSSE